MCKHNRIQEIEDRISGAEVKVEETDSLTKLILKSKKSLTQNIPEIWANMERANLIIVGIKEQEVAQLKSA